MTPLAITVAPPACGPFVGKGRHDDCGTVVGARFRWVRAIAHAARMGVFALPVKTPVLVELPAELPTACRRWARLNHVPHRCRRCHRELREGEREDGGGGCLGTFQ